MSDAADTPDDEPTVDPLFKRANDAYQQARTDLGTIDMEEEIVAEANIKQFVDTLGEPIAEGLDESDADAFCGDDSGMDAHLLDVLRRNDGMATVSVVRGVLLDDKPVLSVINDAVTRLTEAGKIEKVGDNTLALTEGGGADE